MLSARLNAGMAEVFHTVVRAAEGSALVKDQCVQMDFSTSIDGIRVVQPNTGELWGFMGVMDQAVADGELGLCQIWGYRTSSIVFQTNTSQAAGLPLVPVAAANYLATAASTTASNAAVTQQPFGGVLGESIASSSASATISAKVFIRAF